MSLPQVLAAMAMAAFCWPHGVRSDELSPADPSGAFSLGGVGFVASTVEHGRNSAGFEVTACLSAECQASGRNGTGLILTIGEVADPTPWMDDARVDSWSDYR